jgi:hypothetical protein
LLSQDPLRIEARNSFLFFEFFLKKKKKRKKEKTNKQTNKQKEVRE